MKFWASGAVMVIKVWVVLPAKSQVSATMIVLLTEETIRLKFLYCAKTVSGLPSIMCSKPRLCGLLPVVQSTGPKYEVTHVSAEVLMLVFAGLYQSPSGLSDLKLC